MFLAVLVVVFVGSPQINNAEQFKDQAWDRPPTLGQNIDGYSGGKFFSGSDFVYSLPFEFSSHVDTSEGEKTIRSIAEASGYKKGLDIAIFAACLWLFGLTAFFLVCFPRGCSSELKRRLRINKNLVIIPKDEIAELVYSEGFYDAISFVVRAISYSTTLFLVLFFLVKI